MSKKELLTETQIRRFMTLANLKPLTSAILSEKKEESESEKETKHGRTAKGALAKSEEKTVKEAEELSSGLSMEAEEKEDSEEESEEDSEELELDDDSDEEESETQDDDMGADAEESDVDPKVLQAFQSGVQAFADSLGISLSMSSDDEGEELEVGSPEGMQETSHTDNMQEKYEEKMDEAPLSEDALVEAVLARVTSRLVAEAKKKKKTVKEKMDMKKKEKEAAKKKKKKEEVMEEALDGVNLAEKGKDKSNVWKGHENMTMAKGEKGGKGGHEMETVTAKSEHSVTHGGKNLATLGGNKKK